MFTRGGKRQAVGLGPYPAIRLASARIKAIELRSAVAEGSDPKALRTPQRELSFAECAEEFLESMEPQWRNAKHRAQWRMTLGDAYCAAILGKRVSHINTEDILAVLNPIWINKPETASRIRGRVERVLDFAKARGWRTGENPALWRGHLKSILPPRQKLSRGHHAAMGYRQVPALVERLQHSDALAARALEFLICCAARSGEVLGARWEEFDLEAGIWKIPAERTKAGRPHRVPLSKQAQELIRGLDQARTSEFVFAGQRAGRHLSAMAMEMLLRRLRVADVTVHGFRSSFRDWAGEETAHARETAEAALAHVVGDATERAYRRADALEKRRLLMQDWANFIKGGS
ncbi:Integrase [Devosia psychrophila]|nr:Integrase [Devosia psychrophila]